MATVANLQVQIGATIKGLEGSLKKAESSLNKFAKNAQAIGATMSTYLTTPIVGGLGLAVKAASDAEETFSKFATVFRDVQEQSENAFSTLRNEYGLSATASKQLLGDTGDLLTGFGFAQDEALRLSTEVQKLAVDLASFTNFSGGAEGASQALTKALLGERESVKALGIAILEEDVQKQMAINTAKGLTFETERQAKAQATLDLAIQQSTNAIGDYARTSDSFANQLRLVQTRISDLSVEIGQILLPYAEKLLQRTKDLLLAFKSLDTGTKTTVLGIVAITAAIGPALVGLGLMAKGLTTVKTLLMFTYKNPYVLVATGVIALTGYFTTLYVEAKRVNDLLKEPFDSTLPIDEQIQKAIERVDALDKRVAGMRKNLGIGVTTEEGAEAQQRQLRVAENRLSVERQMLVELIAQKKATNEATQSTVDAIDKVANVASVAKPTVQVSFTVEPMADVVKRVTESLQPIEDLLEFEYSVPDKLFPPGSIGYLQTRISTLTELMRGMTNPEDIEAYRLKIEQLQNQLSKLQDGVSSTSQKLIDFGQNLQSVISSSISSFAETIGNAFTGDAGAEGFFNNILLIVAEFGMQLGKALIAAGTAALAFQQLLINPVAAIGAGAALVATSAVVRNLLKDGPKQQVNDALITSSGRVIEFSPKDNILAMQDFSQLKTNSGGVASVRVSVDDIRLSGSDILIAFKNAERAYG